MATNFPGAIDNGTSLPYPSSGNFTNGPSLAGGQDNQNDAIIATQTKLGTGSSAPSGTNLLVSTGTGTSSWSKVAPAGTIVGTTDSQTLTNKILTSPTINSPVITNANITTDAVTGFTVSNTGTIYGVPVTAGVIQNANTVDGAALKAGTVPAAAIVAASLTSTQIATNGVSAANLATNAITLGYAQITSNFSTAGAPGTAVPGLSVNVTVPAGGRRVKITVSAYNMQHSTAVTNVTVSIWDGTPGSGTQLAAYLGTIPGSNYSFPVACFAIVTPAAGAKTYAVGFGSGGATALLSATATAPAFILVEAI